MVNLNKVMLAGTIISDIEIRETNNHTPVTNMKLSITSQYKDPNSGEMKEKSTWITISCFGKIAESVGKYLKKGSGVFIEGTLNNRTWEKEGKKYSNIEVMASKVQFLERPVEDAETPKQEEF